MSTVTTIEWTEKTWNPTTGCDRVSSGCDSCYALTLAKRLKGMGSAKYQRDGDPRTSGPGFAATEHETELAAPLRWRTPSKVFVDSMSDLFHAAISDEFIAKVFATMAASPQHTYQVLTKRHGRMRSLLSDSGFESLVIDCWDELREEYPDRAADRIGWDWYPLPNVWLGVSVEDQKWADIRIPALLDTPAAVRFLSCEPLLGPINLLAWLKHVQRACDRCDPGGPLDWHSGHLWGNCTCRCHPERPPRPDWVIVGGESGSGARPMHPNWARSLRDQCCAAGVAFLFKQWGTWRPASVVDKPSRPVRYTEHPAPMVRVGKHAAGRELDGRTWDEFPKEVA